MGPIINPFLSSLEGPDIDQTHRNVIAYQKTTKQLEDF